MITDRQKEILNLIISLYAQEGNPIASKKLLDSIKASSATIRNDMKILEELGLIEKEYSSSGRIPSTAGYDYLIKNNLNLEKLTENELFQVMKSFDGDFYRLSDLLERAAKNLQELTSLTSVILNIPQKEQELKNFDIVLIDAHSVLVIFNFSTGEVRTNQFVLPRSLSSLDLLTVKEIVTDRLLNKKVLDIHYSLRTEIPQVIRHYFKRPMEVLKLFEIVFDGIFEEKIITVGRELLPELYQTFPEEQLIGQEIRRLTDNDELRIVKFDEETVFKKLTVMSQKFVIPYRGLGTIALIGKKEQDYQKIMRIIDLTAKVLTMKLTDYYRYLDGNHYEIY
ncbi:MAG: heat-inducible transcriptional repressor HrcA [Lactovum sp.]